MQRFIQQYNTKSYENFLKNKVAEIENYSHHPIVSDLKNQLPVAVSILHHISGLYARKKKKNKRSSKSETLDSEEAARKESRHRRDITEWGSSRNIWTDRSTKSSQESM